MQWRRIGINIIEFIYRKLDSVDWGDTGLMFVARRLNRRLTVVLRLEVRKEALGK